MNRLNQLITLGQRIQPILGWSPVTSFEALEASRAELVGVEASLQEMFDTLPPHLRREPSELFLHEAFSTDERAFARFVASASLSENLSGRGLEGEGGGVVTRVGRGDAWDYMYIHALYNTLVCLVHRPRLLLYAGRYRLPNPDSDESRLLLRTVEKAEKSAGFIVTLAERILRAGVTFSQHPALLFGRHEREGTTWSSILSTLSRSSSLLIHHDDSSPPHSNGLKPPPFIAPPPTATPPALPTPRHPMAPPSFRRSPLSQAEVDSHPFMGFALLIAAMTLADLASLHRRSHPGQREYLHHCHAAISL
ncbi:hypothetical protein HDU67_004636, partial [Dinochytrium kinnereticum]